MPDLTIILRDVPEEFLSRAFAGVHGIALLEKGVVLNETTRIEIDYPTMSALNAEAVDTVVGNSVGLYALNEIHKHKPQN